MADYIIIESSTFDNSVTAVWDYTVPAGSNSAGVPWQTVVAEIRAADETAGTSLNPRASAAHIAALDAGSIMEQTSTATFSANDNNAQKLAALEAKINADEARLVTEFSNKYKFYGYVGVS